MRSFMFAAVAASALMVTTVPAQARAQVQTQAATTPVAGAALLDPMFQDHAVLQRVARSMCGAG